MKWQLVCVCVYVCVFPVRVCVCVWEGQWCVVVKSACFVIKDEDLKRPECAKENIIWMVNVDV